MKILTIICLVLLAGSVISAQTADSGLLFYAPFDGNATATIAQDGSATPLVAQNLEFVEGVSGKAVYINISEKASEKASLEYAAENCFTSSSGTVSFWVRPNWDGYKTSTTEFLSYYFFSAFAPNEKDAKNSAMKIRLWMWNWLRCDLVGTEKNKNFMINWKSGSNWLRSAWLRGDWWHIALTWNATDVKLFVNGCPMGTQSQIDVKGISRFFVGGRYGGADAAFDELKIFDRALSDKEVKGEYRTFAPLDFVLERRFIRADSEEKLRIEVAPSAGVALPVLGMLKLRVIADSDERVISQHEYQLDLTKRMTVSFDLPPTPEGDYRIQCSLKTVAGNWQRSFPLTFFKQKKAPPISNAPVTLGKCLVNIDLTLKKGNIPIKPVKMDLDTEIDLIFNELDAATNDESIGGEVRKKDNGYAESTSTMVKIVKGLGTYLELGDKKWARASWELRLPENCSTPLMLEVSWPDDKERAISFYMIPKSPTKQNRDRLSGGVQCGGEYLNSNKMKTTRYLFYPEQDQYLFEIRTLYRGAPAAASRLKIYELAERLPKLAIDYPKKFPRRRFGHLDEDQSFEILLAPDRKTKSRFGYPVKVIERLLDYNDYTGQNIISYPVLRYWWTHLDSPPVNPVGGGMRTTGWITLMLDMMESRGQGLLAEINLYTIPHGNEQDVLPLESRKEKGYFLYDNTGNMKIYSKEWSFGNNPVHPNVRKRFMKEVSEVVRRFGPHPAFKGIDLWLHTPCLFKSLEYGYGDFTVGLFERETGIKVPGSAKVASEKNATFKDPGRFSKRYEFLTGPKRKEWLAWRAGKTTALMTQIDAIFAKAGESKHLYLSMLGWWQTGIRAHDVDLPDNFDLAKFAYENYSIDLEALGKLPSVTVVPVRDGTLYRHIKHWNKGGENIAFELQSDISQYRPFKNGANSAASIYLRYFESFSNSLKPEDYATYFQNSDPKAAGRDFLKDFAVAMAAQDPEQILIGAQPLGTTGRDEVSREFARNYLSLPVGDFKEISMSGDSVVGRYLNTPNGTYLYTVNLLPFAVDVSLRCSTEVSTIKVLATGKSISFKNGEIPLKLKPFELKSLYLSDSKALPKKAILNISPAVEKWYEDQCAVLEGIISYLDKNNSDVAAQVRRMELIKKDIVKQNFTEAYRLIMSKIMKNLPQLKKEAATGTVVFTEKFENREEIEKNWKLPLPKHCVIANGGITLNWTGTSAVGLKGKYDGELMLDVDVTPKVIKKHWGGVGFHGVLFVVREEGFWYVYRVKGENSSRGKMIKRKIIAGETYRFRLVNRGNTYVWFVNGKKISSFTEPGEIVNQKNLPGLVINGLPTTFSNFTLYKIENKE